MPITLIEQASAVGEIEAAGQSTLGIAGFGGTSAIGEATAFILDISVMSNVGPENAGIPQTAATLGIGLTYDL